MAKISFSLMSWISESRKSQYNSTEVEVISALCGVKYTSLSQVQEVCGIQLTFERWCISGFADFLFERVWEKKSLKKTVVVVALQLFYCIFIHRKNKYICHIITQNIFWYPKNTFHFHHREVTHSAHLLLVPENKLASNLLVTYGRNKVILHIFVWDRQYVCRFRL